MQTSVNDGRRAASQHTRRQPVPIHIGDAYDHHWHALGAERIETPMTSISRRSERQTFSGLPSSSASSSLFRILDGPSEDAEETLPCGAAPSLWPGDSRNERTVRQRRCNRSRCT